MTNCIWPSEMVSSQLRDTDISTDLAFHHSQQRLGEVIHDEIDAVILIDFDHFSADMQSFGARRAE